MRISLRTAIIIARRVNEAALSIINDPVGSHPEVERRIKRILAWMGKPLWGAITAWVIFPAMALPDDDVAADTFTRAGGWS